MNDADSDLVVRIQRRVNGELREVGVMRTKAHDTLGGGIVHVVHTESDGNELMFTNNKTTPMPQTAGPWRIAVAGILSLFDYAFEKTRFIGDYNNRLYEIVKGTPEEDRVYRCFAYGLAGIATKNEACLVMTALGWEPSDPRWRKVLEG